MKPEEQDYQLAMEITEDSSSKGYAHINVRFVRYAYGHIEYFYEYSYGKDGMEFNRLQITCQMDDHNPSTYADRISYDGSCIELARAERMVKTLKFIHKGLDKHEQKFGYCEGFADFVIRIADILKVQHFVFRKYKEEDYHENEAKHARYKISRIIQEHINRLQPAKEV